MAVGTAGEGGGMSTSLFNQFILPKNVYLHSNVLVYKINICNRYNHESL